MSAEPTTQPGLEVVPANAATCEELQQVFGSRGVAATCRCQRYKLRRLESFGSFPAEERARRLREQTGCGHPDSDRTSGLLGFLDGEPVGWCAVEPRVGHGGLLRNNRVPWLDRSEDRSDPTVWVVTCFLVRTGFRRRGIATALLGTAVEHARRGGARAIEGYPMVTTSALTEELHVGTAPMFAAAGFVEVTRPTLRRAVMRIDF